VVSPDSEPAGPSRRHVLKAAVVATAGLGATACGGAKDTAPKFRIPIPSHVPSADLGPLSRLLYLEYETVAAYEAGIPLLDEATQKTAEQFLRHELSHADDIGGLIKNATKAKQPPQPGVRYSLGHPRTAAEVLDLLYRLERAQLSAYLWAMPRLSSGPVRAAAAAIFANDAQHVSLLRARLGSPPVPAAFVTGRE
jgi:hypothetical protein